MDAARLYNSVNIISKRKKTLIEFFKKCEEKKPMRGRLLDIGCGDGGVTELIQNILDNPGVQIEATDISEDMTSFANKHYAGTGLYFFVMDIEGEMPIELHGRYDYIISSFVFHWVHDQQKALSNVFSLLQPNGKCLLTFFPKAPHFTAYREMARRARWAPYMKNVERVVSPYQDCEAPEETFRTLMMQCGFRDVEVSCFSRIYNQGSIDSLRSLLRSINPFISRVPESEQEQYLSELMDTYMECTGSLYGDADGRPVSGGPVYYPYHFLKATATK